MADFRIAQGYVDSLWDTKKIIGAAISTRVNPSFVASSPRFPIKDTELAYLLSISDNTSTDTTFDIGSNRYMLVKRHDSGVMLQKSGNGLVTYLTEQAMIIALHDDKTKAEIVLTEIARIGEYMKRRNT